MTLFTKTGSGKGTGSGSCYGNGTGSGSGYGDGTGSGSGYGFCKRYGYGQGSGYGDVIVITSVGKYDVMIDEFGFGIVRVGCQTHPVDWWRGNWDALARKHRIDVEVAEKALAEVVKYLETRERAK